MREPNEVELRTELIEKLDRLNESQLKTLLELAEQLAERNWQVFASVTK